MNVIIANEQQAQVANLDIDVIKSITGTYAANEIVEMFRTFFYSKMVIDVTALKNYNNIHTFRTISEGLDPDKIVFFIPEGSSLCTTKFLSKLVTLGIYNFTTNLDGVKYLLKKSNTYNDVAHIQKAGGGVIDDPLPTSDDSPLGGIKYSAGQGLMARTIKLGVRNLTEHSGATTLIYMFKKELTAIFGESKVIAIEVNKNDFEFYSDASMVSATSENIRSMVDRYSGASVILIDLNDHADNTICDEVIYLLEPSVLKLNKLTKKTKDVFGKIRDKKIILNQNILSNSDIAELEYEAGIKFFYHLPPLNDRKKNEVVASLLEKIGLIKNSDKSETSKMIFGLFRR